MLLFAVSDRVSRKRKLPGTGVKCKDSMKEILQSCKHGPGNKWAVEAYRNQHLFLVYRCLCFCKHPRAEGTKRRCISRTQ